jgi:hypothetical protein
MEIVPFEPEVAVQSELIRPVLTGVRRDSGEVAVSDRRHSQDQAAASQELMFAALSNRAIHPEVRLN